MASRSRPLGQVLGALQPVPCFLALSERSPHRFPSQQKAVSARIPTLLGCQVPLNYEPRKLPEIVSALYFVPVLSGKLPDPGTNHHLQAVPPFLPHNKIPRAFPGGKGVQYILTPRKVTYIP